jgi:hypothetical protein
MSSPFSVLAIIAAYNEADVIGPVVGDLIAQGIEVYFLDDGSTDGTVAAVEPFLGHGVRAIERFGTADVGGGRFDWERILRRKAELAAQLEASWFIHHDADEFRESPWAQQSLKDAIRHVDGLGYNAIDFMGFDFWPTGEEFSPGGDVRSAFPLCSELAPHDRVQIRCWRKAPAVDLASSGGHEAQFGDRRVFPLPFILRHYPIRGQQHGERKVFQERRKRFLDGERERGWHVQYDRLGEGASFVKDPSTLAAFDGDAVRAALPLRAVETLEQALAAGGRRIDALVTETARLDDEVGRRDAELALKDGEIDRRGIEIARRDIEIAARDSALMTLRVELDRRASELAALHLSTRTTLDAHLEHIRAQQDEHRRLQDEHRRLVDTIGERAVEIERWRKAVDGLTRELSDLKASLSWRWTAPARAALRLIRGGQS